MNEIPATVYILDRPYKLKVNPATEQALRKAAALIDSQAKSYGKMYGHQDRQDLLAMVALTQLTQLLQFQESQQARDSRLQQQLGNIDALLSSMPQTNPAPTQNSL